MRLSTLFDRLGVSRGFVLNPSSTKRELVVGCVDCVIVLNTIGVMLQHILIFLVTYLVPPPVQIKRGVLLKLTASLKLVLPQEMHKWLQVVQMMTL